MVEITDRESAKAWFEGQSRDVCVAMAARAALRSAAAIAFADAATQGVIVLLVFRTLLSSGVASIRPGAETTKAAAAAAASALAAAAHAEAVASRAIAAADPSGVHRAGEPFHAAANAARAVVRAAHTASNHMSFGSAESAVAEAAEVAGNFAAARAADTAALASAADARAAAFAALSRDAERFEAGDVVDQVLRRKLWEDGAEPPDLAEARAKLIDFLASDPAAWGFWQRWYQEMVGGRPMRWELQRTVALIPDNVWQEGPAAVAAEIARIEAEFLALALPQAERAEIDEATGRIRFVPIAVENPRLLGAVLGQVADALDDALANPSNGLTERSREARVLRRTIQRHGNDPQRIEMDFVSVHAGLTRQIIVEDLPPSEENLALQRALEEGARAVRATHPDVAENRATLSRLAIAELSPEAVEVIVAAGPVLAAISVPELGDEWAEDAAEIVDSQPRRAVLRRKLGPAVRNAGHIDKDVRAHDAAVRYFSRVAKIAVLLRKTPDLIHRLDQSAGYKAVRFITTIGALVALGGKLFMLF